MIVVINMWLLGEKVKQTHGIIQVFGGLDVAAFAVILRRLRRKDIL